jgi:hypothetical protein
LRLSTIGSGVAVNVSVGGEVSVNVGIDVSVRAWGVSVSGAGMSIAVLLLAAAGEAVGPPMDENVHESIVRINMNRTYSVFIPRLYSCFSLD